MAAYCFDNAVNLFGGALKAELEGVKAKKEQEGERKRAAIFRKWIPELNATPSARQFRDPGRG